MRIIIATILAALLVSPAFSATKKQNSGVRTHYAQAPASKYDPDAFIRNSMTREQALQPY